MIITIRTNSDNKDFQALAAELEAELAIRDGENHVFLAQLNKIHTLDHVVVAYSGDEPVGCGAIREYSGDSMEVKRMYVPSAQRRKGIASLLLGELERWCVELGFTNCVLETGRNQPEAIGFYQQHNFQTIPNFGQYIDVANSVCFEKRL